MRKAFDPKDYEYKVTAAEKVNILGEHVDYCGGKVLSAALSHKNTVYVRPNGTNKINIEWIGLKKRVSLDINKLAKYKSLKRGDHQAGSALAWKDGGHSALGADMVFDCDVPFESGLASSAAVEVSTIAALCAISGETIDNVRIAIAAHAAEREYIGNDCGITDHYASACGKKGMAMLLDCKTHDCEYVPFDLGEYKLIIADTNKPCALVGNKFNDRRVEVNMGLRLLQNKTAISCLGELTEADLKKYDDKIPGFVRDRVRHVVGECARVEKAVEAVKSGDTIALGKLFNESHASLRSLYEVTGTELDTLVFAAQEHEACAGSHMTGMGLGGCAVSLVRSDGLESFETHVKQKYAAEIGCEPTFYDCEIGDGITVEKIAQNR